MADSIEPLQARPALEGGTRALHPEVSLRVPEPRSIVRLQLARPHVGDTSPIRVHDVELPRMPNRCAGDDPAALWLAPDGWLLVARTIDAGELRASAARACGARVASAVDVSDAMVVLELAGAGARPLLARGTGLVLSRKRFAPGQCARTRLAQLAVVLRPRSDDVIELIVDRGPAAWLCEWLADAAVGLVGYPAAPTAAAAAR